MAQVLSNLLNNAAKYTKPGGQIRLAAAAEGDEVVFRVRDNGIGIPPEMLSGIFDLFAQVDHSLDHSQGGLGLGLTLVRSLVEMHGGSVQALSDGPQPGKRVHRPPADPGPCAGAGREPGGGTGYDRRAARTQSRGPSLRVLVVDDNVSSAQSLAMVLKLDGHDVQVSHDGGSCARGGSEVPSRSRADGHRPAGHGRLRSGAAAPPGRGAGTGIALLAAVTGYAEDEARRRSREAGFDHHLVKPVDPDGVLALLASLEWSEPTARDEADETAGLDQPHDSALSAERLLWQRGSSAPASRVD